MTYLLTHLATTLNFTSSLVTLARDKVREAAAPAFSFVSEDKINTVYKSSIKINCTTFCHSAFKAPSNTVLTIVGVRSEIWASSKVAFVCN